MASRRGQSAPSAEFSLDDGNGSSEEPDAHGGTDIDGGVDSGGRDERSAGSGDGADPGSIFGDAPGDYIRDGAGNILYTPTGRARKRRAKRGSSTAKKAAGKKVPVDAMAQLLMLGHSIAANLTKTPELEVNEKEAKMLADPLCDLFVMYDIVPPPELLLAMRAASAMSYVYGPRVAMITMRHKKEREERAAEKAKNVTPAQGTTGDTTHRANGASVGGDAPVLDFSTGFGNIKANYGGLKQ